jgi:hypothetical protein
MLMEFGIKNNFVIKLIPLFNKKNVEVERMREMDRLTFCDFFLYHFQGLYRYKQYIFCIIVILYNDIILKG